MKKIISKLISLTAAAAMVFTLVPEAISAGAAGMFPERLPRRPCLR